MTNDYLFLQFSMEQEAILVKEMRRPDKDLLLRTLREGRANIESDDGLSGKGFLFDPAEELEMMYDEVIEKVEQMSEEDIRKLFEILPMYSDLE
ncbi:hypothetical protein [Sinanaerobacter sp. ZZT-01]|uniref:hypothetical protein n=1 Tax=Sinanaerobacter sp. ZZT-01 TaxID=3111540 RepID=UPI002D76C3EC|nr:hypothetical protein [Sinanaerobacter sp. ZZT-01]WRR94247.1 hypothetical protein U5921_03760 [Sinanaerobacter sp. ZZT-01]